MNRRNLQASARRSPFQPFRVTLTTGEKYDIRHPDLIMVGRRSVIIGIPSKTAPTVYDLTIEVDLLHVVAVEKLQGQKTPPGGSG